MRCASQSRGAAEAGCAYGMGQPEVQDEPCRLAMSGNAARQMLENVAERRAWKCSTGMVPDPVHVLQHFKEMNRMMSTCSIPALQG